MSSIHTTLQIYRSFLLITPEYLKKSIACAQVSKTKLRKQFDFKRKHRQSLRLAFTSAYTPSWLSSDSVKQIIDISHQERGCVLLPGLSSLASLFETG